ncbi:MAG: tight adherence protein, partial [Firmicutes bacterium]|nr:tight adherence protein [Bacillota bacterium]
MSLLIALITFGAVLVILFGVYYYAMLPGAVIRERLSRYVELPAPITSNSPAAPPPFAPEVSVWRAFVRQAGKYFEWSQWSRTIEHKLIQAGLPLRGTEFMAICTLAAVFGGLVMLALSGGGIFCTIGGIMAGYLSPVLVLRIKIAKRVKAFNLELGDALTLVSNSLRTGYSFMQAVEMVAREMPPPISEEFARLLKEMSLGVTTDDAMNNLAKRISSDDL